VTNRRRFLLSCLCLPAAAFAFDTDKPKQILLIRHAEKTGNRADAHLNPRGYLRAAALPRLFPTHFDTPELIVATHASARSNRPVETVTPLAHSLCLTIDSKFADEDWTRETPAVQTDLCQPHGSHLLASRPYSEPRGIAGRGEAAGALARSAVRSCVEN